MLLNIRHEYVKDEMTVLFFDFKKPVSTFTPAGCPNTLTDIKAAFFKELVSVSNLFQKGLFIMFNRSLKRPCAKWEE